MNRQAGSSSDGIAMRYVLPVLWMTSCFRIIRITCIYMRRKYDKHNSRDCNQILLNDKDWKYSLWVDHKVTIALIIFVICLWESCEVLWWACLSVCLSARISQACTTRPNVHHFLAHVACDRGSVPIHAGDMINYVLPVLWITSCSTIMGPMAPRRCRRSSFVAMSCTARTPPLRCNGCVLSMDDVRRQDWTSPSSKGCRGEVYARHHCVIWASCLWMTRDRCSSGGVVYFRFWGWRHA